MSAVRIVDVDERDGSWEDPRPRFRVYLHGSGAESTRGWTATYDVTGADVLQVIDWAQKQAGDRLTYAIALVRDRDGDHEDVAHGRDRGLVWLVGMDGNDVPKGRRRRGRPAPHAGTASRAGRQPFGRPDARRRA